MVAVRFTYVIVPFLYGIDETYLIIGTYNPNNPAACLK